MLPPHSDPSSHSSIFQPTWSHALGHSPRGLTLAREKGWTLAWDAQDWLYLLNGSGERQAQVHTPAKLSTAACADDGSAYAAAGGHGEVWWLLPDLRSRWEKSVGHSVTALAMDPFGQYLAVGDSLGTLTIFDSEGRQLVRTQSQRPLHHLTFILAAPLLVGASDYGLVACFDFNGKLLWHDGIVAHIGSLSVSGAGEKIILACFSEGLQEYDVKGNNLGRHSLSEPAHLAALTYDARHLLVAGMGKHLLWLDAESKILSTQELEKPAVAIAISPLGDRVVMAQAESFLVGFDLRLSRDS
jgi:hypothetical protein